MKFDECFNLVLQAEGGYVNDPVDPGGETIFGVARKKNPTLSLWKRIDEWKDRGFRGKDLERLARADPMFMDCVKATYRGGYWNTCRCTDLPGIMHYPVFSCAVNCGYKTAIKILQRALGIKDDGIFGNQTYLSVRKADPQKLCDSFCYHWRLYYDAIVAQKPALRKYINGWYNRIDGVMRKNNSD